MGWFGNVRNVALATAALVGVPAAAADVTTFDNAGVLLGHNVAEATAALTGLGFEVHRKDAALVDTSDERFLHAIEATKEDDVSRETVVVRFDQPPSEPRAFLIWRTILYKAGKAPLLADYRAAVRSKAGSETYWRDTHTGVVEQYVQWSRSGKARRGLFNALAALPSSYPNPCVTGITIGSPRDALAAKVRMPQYGTMGGEGPPSEPRLLVPQEHCGSGLLIRYQVPDRSTDLTPRVNVLLFDQARMEAMIGKRAKWLEANRAAEIDAAKRSSGKPIL